MGAGSLGHCLGEGVSTGGVQTLPVGVKTAARVLKSSGAASEHAECPSPAMLHSAGGRSGRNGRAAGRERQTAVWQCRCLRAERPWRPPDLQGTAVTSGRRAYDSGLSIPFSRCLSRGFPRDSGQRQSAAVPWPVVRRTGFALAEPNRSARKAVPDGKARERERIRSVVPFIQMNMCAQKATTHILRSTDGTKRYIGRCISCLLTGGEG